jgi:hypothetical protein
MNPDFYRCEIDAINENGARSKTRVIAKAKHWRLITGCISSRLCGKEFILQQSWAPRRAIPQSTQGGVFRTPNPL